MQANPAGPSRVSRPPRPNNRQNRSSRRVLRPIKLMYPEVAGSRRSGMGDGVRPPIQTALNGADDSYREAPMPPGRSLFFWSARLAKPRHVAAMTRLSARFRLILAVALATGACAGGCSTVNRPVQSSTTATSSTSPAAATVRAQSGEPAASPVVSGSAATAVPGAGRSRPGRPRRRPAGRRTRSATREARRRRLSSPVRSTRCSSRYSVRRRRRIGLRCC